VDDANPLVAAIEEYILERLARYGHASFLEGFVYAKESLWARLITNLGDR